MDWVRIKNEWFLLHESISFGVIPGINTCSIYDNLGLFLCLTRSFWGYSPSIEISLRNGE